MCAGLILEPSAAQAQDAVQEPPSDAPSGAPRTRGDEPTTRPDAPLEDEADGAPPTLIEAPVEVQVQGESQADRKRRSAEAVQVVEMEEAKLETADLGEVLARSTGVGVRRGAGLGSSTRFSLNGLTDDQVRFFLDGVPLSLAGYPFGIANVPVNLVERVEVYRGVVPIRFGADALGGAVNLVSDQDVRGTHGAASYQGGSFGTHRFTAAGRHLHEPSGFFTRVEGFLDVAENDYTVDVEIPDTREETRGQPVPIEAHRFNDAYRAGGARVEMGFVDRPWAERLLLRTFLSDAYKQLQSNLNMDRPYGEVEYDERVMGATVQYVQRMARYVRLDLLAGYSHERTDFLDVATCIYDWLGQCVRERMDAGEITPNEPRDDTLFDNAGYARLNAAWLAHPDHTFRLSLSPTYVARHGWDRIRTDPRQAPEIEAERDLVNAVSGLEYQLDLFDERLENIAFFKSYVQYLRSRDPVVGGGSSVSDRSLYRFGGGDALRYRFTDWIYAKASYEYATRLPNADEVFGDALLTNANLDLQPEVSHNLNLGATLDWAGSPSGRWEGEINGFLRKADNLILLLPAYGQRFRHENVYSARSVGVEASGAWTSPGDYLRLDGNVTYLDFRNLSDTEPFAIFEGDRIPNRPYFFANASAQLAFRDAFAATDRISLTWRMRYVHEFFEFWESAGTRESKTTIPDQRAHSLALTYLIERGGRDLSFTGEVTNLTDAQLFDFFGAQRPGRAGYFKVTAAL